MRYELNYYYILFLNSFVSLSKNILEHFNKNEFFKVMPRDYETMLLAIQKHRNDENPILAAFHEVVGH